MNKLLILTILSSIILINSIDDKFPISQDYQIKASHIDNKIMFEVEFKKFGYVGICFGNTMTNTDMIIAELKEDNSFSVKDTWSRGHRKPAEDSTLPDGKDDILNKVIIKKDKISIIRFERLLITGDKYDSDIEITKSMQVTLAWLPENPLSYHGSDNYKFLFLTLDSRTNDFIFSENEQEVKPKIIYTIHGFGQYIVWALLNSIGIIFTRYFKHLWYSRLVHAITSGLTSAFSIFAGVLLIYNLGLPSFDEFDFSDYNSVHKIVGLFTLGVIAIQALLGIASYLLIFKFEKKVFSKAIRNTHKFIGYLLIIVTYFLLFIGFNMQYPEYSWINLTSTIIFLLAIILLEMKETIISKKITKSEFHTKYNSLWSSLPIDSANFNEIREKNPNRKLVIVFNFICDITDYIPYHPGGRKNLEKNINSDVTRFLIGNVNSLDFYCPHVHSDTIIEFIIGKYAIAKLDLLYNPLVKLNYSLQSNSDIELLNREYNYANINFTKTSAEEIYKDIYKFKFTPNENIEFATNHIGLSQLGKHYVITSEKTRVSRMYSICFMMNHEIKEKYIRLSNQLLSSNEPLSKDSSYLLDNKYTKHIELNIKVYKEKKDSFSNQIMNQNEFIINGPVGVGTNLPTTLEGTYVIFSSGTGMFCFLDFIAFTFRYINYRINGNSAFYASEDFSYVKPSFKLKVYSTFPCKKSSVMHDFCFNVMKICLKFNLNIFEFTERISEEGHKRWDKEFVRNTVIDELNNLSKVYLCGNPSFMNEIERNLSEFDNIIDKVVQL